MARKRPSRVLGAHPDGGKPVTLKEGRYGAYVQHGATRATLPKDVSPDTVELGQALELLAAKASRGDDKGKKKNGGGKATGKSAPRSASGKTPKTAEGKTAKPRTPSLNAAKSKATKSPATETTATKPKVQAGRNETAKS
jgi:DNA topoisomerase-1